MKPNVDPRQSIPGPHDVVRVTLNNGITILVRENHAAPVAVLEGALPAGAVNVAKDKAGLAPFTCNMLMRGSEHFDFDAFNERIEGVGASLSVSASDHSADFGFTCLTEDFTDLLELLADTLRRPLFPESHIERIRRHMLVGIQEREQDTQQVASLRFYEAMYGDHPYGRSNAGYLDTVQRISRQDLIDFHTRYFTPAGAVIVVTGDVSAEVVLDKINEEFGDWTGPSVPEELPPIRMNQDQRRLDFTLSNKVQADIVIGCPAVSRHHRDFHPIRVANTILGQFGLMGRLGESVREEQGLAYYAHSSLDTSPFSGVWLAAAGVNPYNVNIAVESILDQFDRLASERVADTELNDSQAFLTGVVPLTLETNEGVANTLLQMEWHDLGLDYLQRYDDIVFGVTADDVLRVAATYLRREKCLTVVAGPDAQQSKPIYEAEPENTAESVE